MNDLVARDARKQAHQGGVPQVGGFFVLYSTYSISLDVVSMPDRLSGGG
ncbi:hypothetical protein [Burkholderia stagnalis]